LTPEVVGIVNLTEDSFSDGDPDPAVGIARGEQLLRDGADWLDLGAESSNPSGAGVPAAVEIERLMPVIRHFAGRVPLSVDTVKPDVMQAALAAGVSAINDVSGGADPEAAAVMRRAPQALWVLMHARNRGPRAETVERPVDGIVAEIVEFFEERIARLGVDRARIVLDPGMGFFLGGTPAPSLAVLRGLRRIAAIGPLYVCVSRKSFLGTLTGRVVADRGAATLAAELWAAREGARWIRTHDVRALRDALTVEAAIRGSDPGASPPPA
jgi:dihydropteroate synthase type 2